MQYNEPPEEGFVKRTVPVRIFRGEKQDVAECLDLPRVTKVQTQDDPTQGESEVYCDDE